VDKGAVAKQLSALAANLKHLRRETE
jgi:hypothetical protein